MLKLTRRPYESLLLETSDGEIEVIIREIKGKQIQILIDAPDEVSIVRNELVSRRSIVDDLREGVWVGATGNR